MAKRITAYETPDGEIFKHQDIAQHHEARVSLAKFLEEKGALAGGGWNVPRLCEFLLSHAEEIRSILLWAHADCEAED